MKTCPRCAGQYHDEVRFCPRDGSALPEVTDPLVGKVLLGQFEIIESCGRGAMGTVYRARQVTMDRMVAIKVLRRDLLRDPAVVKRFHREARAVARLSHPNIVTVLLIGEMDGGVPYLVMEFVEGEALSSVCAREGALPPARALGIARQIGSALGEAHAASVVHRDLKPENISVGTRRRTADFVKVLDFGIAKILGAKSDVSHLTRTGAIFGTPHYIAPEQASGGEVDHRADLYSLGVILFRMLTGRLPFDGTGGMQVLLAHIREQPPRPRDLRPELSPELEQVVMRGLAKDPAARWQSADEFAEALDRVPEARAPVEPSPRTTWAGVGGPAQAYLAAEAAAESAAPPPAAAAGGTLRGDGAAESQLATRPRPAQPPPAESGAARLPSTVAVASAAGSSSTGSALVPAASRGGRFLGAAALVVVLAGGAATAGYFARDRGHDHPAAAAAGDAAPAAAAPPDAGTPPPDPPGNVEAVSLSLESYGLEVSYPSHPTARTDTTFNIDARDRAGRPLESAKVTLGLRAPRARPRAREIMCPGKASARPGRFVAVCPLRDPGSYHAHVYLQVGGEKLQQGFDFVVQAAESPREPAGGRPHRGHGLVKPDGGRKERPAQVDAGAGVTPPESSLPWPAPPTTAPPDAAPQRESLDAGPPPAPPEERPGEPGDIYQMLDRRG